MGLGIENDIWEIQDKLRDQLESHKNNLRAKGGFVFVLDNCIERINQKTQEKTVTPSRLWDLFKDDEVKNLLHKIVSDQITYLYLNTKSKKDQVKYCASFNKTILDFLGTNYVVDENGNKKEIEFPCLIYFKYEGDECTNFLYKKLIHTDNANLIFHELENNLKTFIDGLHDPKSLDINNPKLPMLKLITNFKWKEIKEKILDKTKDHLLDRTIEYSAAAAPLAFVALSTIFTK
jgi:hypothetical protein